MDELLRSHDVDPAALRQDDFAGFFDRRFERLLKQIEAAMGKPVNRRPDLDESPFADERRREAVKTGIERVLQAGESKVVEFKSTGRKNLHTGDKDPKIEWSVIKSIAGFMNASGGTLVVGVDDEGRVLGIEEDYPFVKNQDRDGWELWLTDLLTKGLGKAAAAEVDTAYAEFDGRTVARLDVGPAVAPVFAEPDGRPVFLVRINNSTQEMAGQDALAHQRRRWP